MPKKPTLASNAADLLPVPVEVIERRIYLIRAQKVMLDSGLARLYQVETFNLNRADLRTQARLWGAISPARHFKGLVDDRPAELARSFAVLPAPAFPPCGALSMSVTLCFRSRLLISEG